MSTTALVLKQKLTEVIGDFIELDTSTNLSSASTAIIISSDLLQYDRGLDDYFNHWWAYITEGLNAGVNREVSDYTSTAYTLKLRGAALSSTSAAATFRLHRYNPAQQLRALNNASREIYPNLFRSLDDHTLITGNILPNSHFEDWAAATIPDFYTAPTGSVAAATTYIRGGAKSAYLTAGATPDYFYITSNDYPRLLDLMGKTVDFRCWAYPVDTADDATIQIYTIKADATAQTLTSTTANPKGAWTLLEINNEVINDDIVEIQFRFRVKTTTKHAYFDNARVIGQNRYEYLLPQDFQDGDLKQVYVQTEGYSDDACDDLLPRSWERIYGFKVIDDGTDKFIRLPFLYTDNRQIRLIGIHPLETLTTDASTVSIDGETPNLLIAYAAYLLFEMERGVVSSEDVSRYDRLLSQWWGKYKMLLPHLKMASPRGTMKLPSY